MEQKIEEDPTSITAADARHMQRLEAKVHGGTVDKDGIAAHAQSLAKTPSERANQSKTDKERGYETVLQMVKHNLAADANSVTPKDVGLLMRKDMKAHGGTESETTKQIQMVVGKQELMKRAMKAVQQK